jgi:hypothetical protein
MHSRLFNARQRVHHDDGILSAVFETAHDSVEKAVARDQDSNACVHDVAFHHCHAAAVVNEYSKFASVVHQALFHNAS